MRKKSSSPARIAANRANGTHSTGPRTAEGKARSSQNSLKHGLRSERSPLKLSLSKGPSLGDELRLADKAIDLSLPSEQEAFLTTLTGFLNDLHPVGPFETQLVERLAQLTLRLNRAARMETAHLEIHMTMIYESNGAGLPEEKQTRDNWLAAMAFLKNPSATTLIAQYESRISRDFARTLTQLRQAQNLRAQGEAQSLRAQHQGSLASDGQVAASPEQIPAEQTQPAANRPESTKRAKPTSISREQGPLCPIEAPRNPSNEPNLPAPPSIQTICAPDSNATCLA